MQRMTSDTLIGYLPIFQMLHKTDITGIILNRTIDVLGTN